MSAEMKEEAVVGIQNEFASMDMNTDVEDACVPSAQEEEGNTSHVDPASLFEKAVGGLGVSDDGEEPKQKQRKLKLSQSEIMHWVRARIALALHKLHFTTQPPGFEYPKPIDHMLESVPGKEWHTNIKLDYHRQRAAGVDQLTWMRTWERRFRMWGDDLGRFPSPLQDMLRDATERARYMEVNRDLVIDQGMPADLRLEGINIVLKTFQAAIVDYVRETEITRQGGQIPAEIKEMVLHQGFLPYLREFRKKLFETGFENIDGTQLEIFQFIILEHVDQLLSSARSLRMLARL